MWRRLFTIANSMGFHSKVRFYLLPRLTITGEVVNGEWKVNGAAEYGLLTAEALLHAQQIAILRQSGESS